MLRFLTIGTLCFDSLFTVLALSRPEVSATAVTLIVAAGVISALPGVNRLADQWFSGEETLT